MTGQDQDRTTPGPGPRDEAESYYDWVERMSMESVAYALDQAAKKREARRELRAQLKARRDAGLKARHAQKLNRKD